VTWFYVCQLSIIAERKLDLKVYTVGNSEYTSLQLFSDEDGSPAGRVFIAVIVSTFSFLNYDVNSMCEV